MPIAIGSTFGALLLSSWVATGLSAIVYFQSYVFFRSRPMQDTRHSATLVVTLCILDIAHITCVNVSLYHYLIGRYGQPGALEALIPPLSLTIGLTALITFISQVFFARRVWKLSRMNKPVTAAILSISLGRLCCGWVTSIRAVQLGTFAAFTTHLRFLFTTGVTLSVTSDVIITASLYYWLNESRSGNRSTDIAIDKIIRFAIETGTVTSAASTSSLVCIIIMPRNLVFMAIHIFISKLYITCLLASLNKRSPQCVLGHSDAPILSRIRFSRPSPPSTDPSLTAPYDDSLGWPSSMTREPTEDAELQGTNQNQ